MRVAGMIMSNYLISLPEYPPHDGPPPRGDRGSQLIMHNRRRSAMNGPEEATKQSNSIRLTTAYVIQRRSGGLAGVNPPIRCRMHKPASRPEIVWPSTC